MKSILTATAIVFAMTGAANATIVWKGDIFVKSAKCSAPGSGAGAPGDFAEAMFVPKVLNNAKQDLLLGSSIKGIGAMQWAPTQTSGLLHGTKAVVINAVDTGGYWTRQFPTSAFTVQPSSPTNTTTSVNLTFTFTQPDGCIVTMSGILVGPWPNK